MLRDHAPIAMPPSNLEIGSAQLAAGRLSGLKALFRASELCVRARNRQGGPGRLRGQASSFRHDANVSASRHAYEYDRADYGDQDYDD